MLIIIVVLAVIIINFLIMSLILFKRYGFIYKLIYVSNIHQYQYIFICVSIM